MYTAIINMYFKATVPERTLSHLVITVTSKIRIILIKAYTKSKYKKKTLLYSKLSRETKSRFSTPISIRFYFLPRSLHTFF